MFLVLFLCSDFVSSLPEDTVSLGGAYCILPMSGGRNILASMRPHGWDGQTGPLPGLTWPLPPPPLRSGAPSCGADTSIGLHLLNQGSDIPQMCSELLCRSTWEILLPCSTGMHDLFIS